MTQKEQRILIAIGIVIYVLTWVFFGFPEDDGFWFR